MSAPPAPIPALRAAGVPDAIIARAYGISRQAIHARYGPRPDVPPLQPAPAPAPPPGRATPPDEAAGQLPRVMLAWRNRRGLSQAAAARSIGIDSVTWSRWETGRSGCALPAVMLRLLQLLDRK